MLIALLSITLPPIGSHPSTWEIYRKNIDLVSNTFTCFDGKKVVGIEKINDNFVDCDDGSDEPGTDSFPNGTFYCNNSGYISSEIPKWSVGDGICDCCDGSDEWYNKHSNCSNTCLAFEVEKMKIVDKLTPSILKGIQLQEKLVAKGESLMKKANKKGNSMFFDTLLRFLKVYIQKKKDNHRSRHEKPLNRFEQMVFKLFVSTFGKIDNRKPFGVTIIDAILSDIEEYGKSHKDYYSALANLYSKGVSYVPLLPLYKTEISKTPYKVSLLDEVKDQYNTLGKFVRLENNTMIYENGDHCYVTQNNRKAEVNMQCWNEDRFLGFDEPQTCVYRILVATPAGCNKDSLIDLQKQTYKYVAELAKSLNEI